MESESERYNGNKSSAGYLDATNDYTLLMNENCKVLENFVSLSDLFFYLSNTVFPLLNYGLIERNLIVKQKYFLPACVC